MPAGSVGVKQRRPGKAVRELCANIDQNEKTPYRGEFHAGVLQRSFRERERPPRAARVAARSVSMRTQKTY